jgi:hypothetical protein
MRSLRAWGMGAAVAAVGACQLIAGVGDPKLVATGGSGGRGGGGGSGNAGGEGCMDATDTDAGCGGPTCPKCGPGQTCEVGSDCASGSCVDMTCAAMCTEENENDAGCGVSCPGCAIGQPCTTNADCASGVCESTTCVDYLVWAKRLGSVSGTDRTSLVGLGVDATGNAAFAANFNGQASFGGATYNTGSGFGMGFGRYDPLGSYIWDAAFVDQSNILNVERFNVTPSGDFAALGDFGGSGIDFGGGWQVPPTTLSRTTSL